MIRWRHGAEGSGVVIAIVILFNNWGNPYVDSLSFVANRAVLLIARVLIIRTLAVAFFNVFNLNV